MKIEEALKQLDSLIEHCSIMSKDSECDEWNKDVEALEMARDALDKQIPKKAPIKPLYFEGNPEPIDYMVHCPDCDEPICYPTEYEAKEYYQYCPHCGRRVEWNWSDEE